MSDRRRFWLVLGAILAVALAGRVAYVLTVTQFDNGFYDAAYYEHEARRIAGGDGFVYPLPSVHGGEQAADHPPLTVFALVPVAELPGDSQLWMRLTMVVLGVGVVVLVALLARLLAGDRVGLLAGALATVYANLWINDGLLMSETLASLTTVAAILLAYGLIRRPSAACAAALGATCGLATLTRAELALLFPVVALPAVWIAFRPSTSRLLQGTGAALAALVVVVAPWVVFNLTRFDEVTFVSTNDGLTLLGSTCHDVFYGPGTGEWTISCIDLEHGPKGDQSTRSRIYRDRAIDRIGAHLSRFPVVALARVGRLWSVYGISGTIGFNEGEGRKSWASWLGVAMLFVLAPLAVGGAVVMRRRRTRPWLLLAPAVVVTLMAIVTYGIPRFRAPAEPSIVVLAAIGLAALLGRWAPAWTPTLVPAQPGAEPASDAPNAIEASSSS